ncbi:MAG: hypothetical protein RLZZ241_370 [Bacteroidota bacterium]|jgi:mannose-6-phosphate isomerase
MAFQVYPLGFHPIFKERIWGGSKLNSRLNKVVSGDFIGESWEISGVPDSESVVSKGVYSGRTLTELCNTYPNELLGKRVVQRFGAEFPLLIKFIDAREDLSIQLHPDDAMAKARHGSFGKTEMWYILDADPGAKLIVGFDRNVTAQEYEAALSQGKLTELLHYQQVASGDTVFIPAGKIHAIGAGVLLAEIQQSSDVTYRVYDFNRRDASGHLRELHTDLALDAMDFACRDDFNVKYNRNNPGNPELMVESQYFTTRYLRLDQMYTTDLSSRDAFTILICVSGNASVQIGDQPTELFQGQTVLIPAMAQWIQINTSGCELLEVTI